MLIWNYYYIISNHLLSPNLKNLLPAAGKCGTWQEWQKHWTNESLTRVISMMKFLRQFLIIKKYFFFDTLKAVKNKGGVVVWMKKETQGKKFSPTLFLSSPSDGTILFCTIPLFLRISTRWVKETNCAKKAKKNFMKFCERTYT